MPDILLSSAISFRRFLSLFLLVTTIVVVGAGSLSWQRHHEVLKEGASDAEHQARAFEAHLTFSLTLLDLSLAGLSEQLETVYQANALSALLTQNVSRLPLLRSLSVINDQGVVIASSNPSNVGIRVPTLDAVPQVRSQKGILSVGYPWGGRDLASGNILDANMPITANRQGFIPLLRYSLWQGQRVLFFAALNPDFYMNFYARQKVSGADAVSLLRYDGLPLFHYVENGDVVDSVHNDWVVSQLEHAEIGQSDPFASAGSPVISAYRSSRQFPVVLAVHLDRESILQAWRREAINLALVATLLVGLVAAISFFLYRHERKLWLARLEAKTRERDLQSALLDVLPAQVLLLDQHGQILHANPGWFRFASQMNVPFSHDPTGMPFIQFYEHVWPADFAGNRFIEVQMQALLEGRMATFDHDREVMMSDGVHWFHISTRALQVRDLVGAVVMVVDVSEQRATEKNLRLAASVFQASTDGIIVTDECGYILSVNPAFCSITGYCEEDVLGKKPNVLASGLHEDAFYREMWAQLLRSGLWQGEVFNRRQNGVVYPEWLTISAVTDRGGEVSHYVGVFSDITERKASEERIRYLSEHDALTGLANRVLFQRTSDAAISRAATMKQRVALLFIDLDRFKLVNDTLGHHIGDLLLKEVAIRLSRIVGESGMVCRQGGDEFLILLNAVNSPESVAQVASYILDAISAPFSLEGEEACVTPSVGIALYPDDGESTLTLLKNADTAMYHSKAHGRHSFHFFTASMNASASERVALESGLRVAVERNELRLLYQPLIDLKSGQVIGVEALMRWHHPEWGIISPVKFIPIAEDSGLIVDIGAWALEEACRQGVAWQKAGLPPMRMAVNVSAVQLAQPQFCEMVMATLAASGLSLACLELEVTESLLVEQAGQSNSCIHALKALGIQLSVDDFGTGYSSLAYLRQLPVSKLKIDRSFVRDVTHNQDDAAIVIAIVQMARSMGLEVLAEGVESAEQHAFLAHQGCDQIQGFYFSYPLPPEDFVAFFEAHSLNKDLCLEER